MAYEDVKAILEDRASKKIANNTHLHSHPDGIVMNLHGNGIATFAKGYIKLSSAGWRTNTTKDRLNTALVVARIPLKNVVYQHDWVWYFGWYNPKHDVVFYDGIMLDYQGNVLK